MFKNPFKSFNKKLLLFIRFAMFCPNYPRLLSVHYLGMPENKIIRMVGPTITNSFERINETYCRLSDNETGVLSPLCKANLEKVKSIVLVFIDALR